MKFDETDAERDQHTYVYELGTNLRLSVTLTDRK